MLTSPIPALGTYAAAVEFLAPDVVEAIERSLPCPTAADGRHIWDEEQVWNAAGCIRRDWWCVHCGLTSSTDPIPVDERPYPGIHSAAEHYSVLTYGEAIR